MTLSVEVGEFTTQGSVGKFDLTVKATSVALDKLWQERHAAMAEESANKQQWETALSDEERRVAQEMIHQALRTLIEDPEWVPYRTKVEDGHVIDLNLRILLTDVDEEVQRQEVHYLKVFDEVRGSGLALGED